MSNSTILAIPEVGESQSNKYLTVNNAIAALEQATNAVFENAAVGAGPVSLTELQAARYMVYEFSGASADFDVVFPDTINTNATSRVYAVKNDDATYTLTLDAGGTTVPVEPGASALVYQVGLDTKILSSSAGVPVIPYDIGAFIPGLPDDNGKVFKFMAPRAITFPANLAGSYGHADVNPTLSAVFTVYKNGLTAGTITISGLGVFTFATTSSLPIELVAGDRLEIIAPTPQDATLSAVSLMLAGIRV
jgi:hypothetical protein